MNIALWLRFAGRDLRSGLQGFWIFLTCLALGTGTIAIIGALSASVERGIDEQGQPLLGGDLEFSLVHRQTTEPELAFIASKGDVSKVATVRGMALTTDSTALVEVKAVDGNYPLYGAMVLEGGMPLAGAIATKDGVAGAAADPLLLGRLGLKLGDRIKLGGSEIEIRALIANEPDRLSDTLVLGPRLMISPETLAATGIVQPGSLVTYRYRVKLADTALTAAKAVEKEADATFKDAGWRIRTRNNAAAGADGFVERLGYFMTLVGLASLIVGGAGIANAVQKLLSSDDFALSELGWGTAFLALCIGSKLIPLMIAGRWIGLSRPESLLLGLLLNTRGLMELVILSVGLSSGIFSPVQYSIFVMVTVATTLMSTPLSRLIQRRLEPSKVT